MGDKCLALAARVRAAGSLEVLIYDDIGEGFFGPGITAKAVREQLDAAGMVTEIDVRVNSSGGDTAQGFAIYNAFREHPAKVTVHIDGDAMSIASIIAQAGDRRVIAPNARMMIHEAKLYPGRPMGVRELKSALQNVEQVNDSLVATYEKHTKREPEEIRQWMAEETYMSAATAKERGFVDEISGESAEMLIAAWATVRPPTGPQGGKEDQMAMKTIALAVGLTEAADEGAIAARVGELVSAAAAGKAATKSLDDLVLALGCDNVEAAKGAAVALAESAKQAKTLAQDVAELKAQAEKNAESVKRDSVLATIRANGQASPALEVNVFPAMTIVALESFAKNAPRVAGKSAHRQVGEGEGAKGAGVTSAKDFAALKPSARAELKNSDPSLYESLHTEAVELKLL